MSQVPTGDWGRSASLDMHVYSESVPSVSLRKKDQATEFLHTLSLEYFLTVFYPPFSGRYSERLDNASGFPFCVPGR